MRRRVPQMAGNRRVAGRGQHLLDVKVRAVTARRERRRVLTGWFWKGALILSISVAGWLGVTTALDKFFFSNSEYTLQRITVDLDGIMTREEALAEAGIQEGSNIFEVDLAAAERALRAIPVVENAVIERELPDTISIRLTARTPVAWVAPPEKDADPFDPERALLVDGTGFLMKPRLIHPDYYHLPVVHGVRSDNIRDGEPLHNEDLRRGLALLDEVAQRPETLLRIRSLNIGKGYCLEVVSDRNARIVFAPEDFTGQLSRLQLLLEHCQETGRELESVNLMVRRNTPVTFVQPPEPPREARLQPSTRRPASN